MNADLKHLEPPPVSAKPSAIKPANFSVSAGASTLSNYHG
jgi:hypothetical protein